MLKNPRGRIMARVPMTVENAGLDLYTAKLQAGEHSTLNPWDAEFAEVKKQLGNWRVAIEGWEDTYGAWLHDARIKVDVLSDVENTLTSGSELLTRWASTRDANLNAEQRKTLREAAKSMMDTSLDAKSRLTFADNADIEALHETNPLRDGLTSSGDHVFHVERPEVELQRLILSSSRVPRAPTSTTTARRCRATSTRPSADWSAPRRRASTSCTCPRSSRSA